MPLRSSERLFEEPVPSGEAAVGAGTTTALTTGATRRKRFCRWAQRKGPVELSVYLPPRNGIQGRTNRQRMFAVTIYIYVCCTHINMMKVVRVFRDYNAGIRLSKISISSEPACHVGAVSFTHWQTEHPALQLGVNYTQDPWVLESIQGHELELTEMPTQGRAPEEFHLSQELEKSITEELSKLLEKGAITPVAQSYLADSFVSQMFLMPKKNGSYKPIMDLRELNKSI